MSACCCSSPLRCCKECRSGGVFTTHYNFPADEIDGDVLPIWIHELAKGDTNGL